MTAHRRKEGTIVRWDDAKGFGFIRSGALAQDVFVHARDYRSTPGEAPRQGLRVTFEHIHVAGKGPRALVAFFAYWQDKYAAQNGRWRVKEDTLHLWSLAGGWAGAWFAQQALRHKSVKARFRTAYRATVMLHCAAVFGFWWLSRTR